MNNAITELKQKFSEIKAMGYIKASRNGYTGIGKTFEDLLGKKEDTNPNPDYKGIEIKTKRGYSKGYVALFNNSFLDQTIFPAQRIKDQYGYPHSQLKQYKILECSIYAHKLTLVSNRWFFKLIIDEVQERIYIAIYDLNYNLIEKECYWEFATLKTRLINKLSYLALVRAWPTTREGVTYYKYYRMDIYKLKSFDNFIDQIKKVIFVYPLN